MEQGSEFLFLDGAKKIFTDVDNVFAGGGTYLAPALNIAKSYFANGQAVFHLQEFRSKMSVKLFNSNIRWCMGKPQSVLEV